MLVDGVTYEQNVVYKHNVMVLNLKKEWSPDTCYIIMNLRMLWYEINWMWNDQSWLYDSNYMRYLKIVKFSERKSRLKLMMDGGRGK
jgi:hypothetical protein